MHTKSRNQYRKILSNPVILLRFRGGFARRLNPQKVEEGSNSLTASILEFPLKELQPCAQSVAHILTRTYESNLVR